MKRDGLDQLCIDTIRFLAVDAVENAKSGHPGLPLGAAPLGLRERGRIEIAGARPSNKSRPCARFPTCS